MLYCLYSQITIYLIGFNNQYKNFSLDEKNAKNFREITFIINALMYTDKFGWGGDIVLISWIVVVVDPILYIKS